MSNILRAIESVHGKTTVAEIAPIQPIKPIGAYTPPKPAAGAQTQQAVAPTEPTANVKPVPGTIDPSAVGSFSDVLKKIMANSGLKSEFDRLINKVK
jgi:hypothetical protein